LDSADDLYARIVLEYARVAEGTELYSLSALLKDIDGRVRRHYSSSAAKTVDADRLASHFLQLRLAQEALLYIGEGAVESWGYEIFNQKDLVPGYPRSIAHFQIPPLFATMAEALVATGDVDQALQFLRPVSAQASKFDAYTVQCAERALLRISWRMRLEGDRSAVSLKHDTSPNDATLLWVRDALGADREYIPIPKVPANVDPLPWLHAVWRTRYALSSSAKETLINWGAVNLGPFDSATTGDFFAVSVQFDLIEAQLLRGSFIFSPEFRFNPLEWYQARPTQPEEALRLWLRASALRIRYELQGWSLQEAIAGCSPFGAAGEGTVSTVPVSNAISTTLINRLGLRAAGNIALEEADLLALRLPEHALTILEAARKCFELCNDFGGNRIAGIKQAMIEGALGRSDDLKNTLAEVARRPFVGGHQWEELERIAINPTVEALDSLGSSAWRPSQVRLIACMARARDATAPTRAGVLYEWLLRKYGSGKSGQNEQTASQNVFAACCLAGGELVPIPLCLVRTHWIKRA
jgi:hypothetical protein